MLIEMQDTSKYPQVFDYLKAKTIKRGGWPVGTYPKNWKGNTEDVSRPQTWSSELAMYNRPINTTLQPSR